MAPIRPVVALCKVHLGRNPTGSLAEEQGAGPCGCGLVLTTGCLPPDPRPGDDAESGSRVPVSSVVVRHRP